MALSPLSSSRKATVDSCPAPTPAPNPEPKPDPEPEGHAELHERDSYREQADPPANQPELDGGGGQGQAPVPDGAEPPHRVSRGRAIPA